jgi:hypothetical protein
MPDLDRRSFIAAASITASLVSAPVVDAREPAKVLIFGESSPGTFIDR